MDAAKSNDVEAMKTLGKGLNANAKNVVGLNRQTLCLHLSLLHFIVSHKQGIL